MKLILGPLGLCFLLEASATPDTAADGVKAMPFLDTLNLSGSCVIFPKSILARKIFSLSTVKVFIASCICGLGGMTPPRPMARMIFIFLSIAGFGATEFGALKMPRLFKSRERQAFVVLTGVLTVEMVRVLAIVSVAMVSVLLCLLWVEWTYCADVLCGRGR